MAKVWTDIKPRASSLRRLAIVFADPLRVTIVGELYLREMSPVQFFQEFGGGSLSKVERHFKTLAEHDWLRLVKEESGGSWRGGAERFYRATELAVFDNESWSQLPYSIKAEFTWRGFQLLAERVRAALRAGTFDARPDRHLSWTPLRLDRRGWDRVVAAVGSLFEALFEEQADAKLRIADSGEKPIFATVALEAFESPSRALGPDDEPIGSRLAEAVDSPVPLMLRLSKVFADPVCLKIVTELNLRKMSATQFHDEFGDHSSSDYQRRFKMLAEIGWLKKVDEKTGGNGRGATECLYRATRPAIFDNGTWSDLPVSIKTTYSWRTFEQLSEQVKEAIEAGTFYARSDHHHTWSLLQLDQLGWEHVAAAVDTLFAFIFEEQESVRLRIAESAEAPFTATVAMAAFESPSPKGSAKAT